MPGDSWWSFRLLEERMNRLTSLKAWKLDDGSQEKIKYVYEPVEPGILVSSWKALHKINHEKKDAAL